MKNSVLSIITAACLLISTAVIAQAPQAFNYQAVARNASGQLLTSQNIGIRFTITDAASGGNVLYSETHTKSTNQFGLFTAEVGNGTPTGSFGSIDWASGNRYMKVEIDPAGGTSYSNLGTAQLLSVPYALNAPDKQTLSWSDATKTLTIEGGNNVVLPVSGGSVGPTGPKGDTGAKGATGTNGTNGVTGTTGVKGDTGAKGATGNNGTNGVTGATGTFGVTGTTGQTIHHNGTAWVANSLVYNNGTNVGVGTTTPGIKLHVKGDGADGALYTPSLFVQNNTGFQNALSVRLKDNITDLVADYTGTANATNLTFSTRASGGAITEKMRITPSGDLGVGTTAPTTKLHVNGNVTIPSTNNYRFATAVSRKLNIPATAFNYIQTDASTSTATGDGFESGNSRWVKGGATGINAYMYAPVYLPDSAVISQISARVIDNNSTYEASVILYSHATAGTTVSNVASTTASGTTFASGFVSLTSPAISHVVSDQNVYYLRFNTKENASSLRILNATITYSVFKAD